MNKRTLITASALLLLAGCFPQTPATGGGASSSSSMEASSSSEDLPETNNVTYTGMVAALPAPMADATHVLQLDSGRQLPIVSTDTNLQLGSYIGKRVDARGSLKVAGDVNVLHVMEVVVLSSPSSSERAAFCGGIAGVQCPDGMACVDDPSDSCDPNNGGADCGGMCVQAATSSSTVSSSSSQAAAPAVSSSTSSSSSSSSSAMARASSSSSAAATSSVAMSPNEEEVATMAKQNYAPALWTQQYCTGHVGLCVPVHKNWYYKSFGATTSTLWHVEFGMSDIQALGKGSISLNLISGSAEEAGGTDGKVQTKGGLVVGYKNWDSGRHLELAADARLTEAVTYMLEHLEHFTPSE